MEIWKRIPGYLGYDVSNYGQVRSYSKRVGNRWSIASVPQRILKQASDTNGCPFVLLSQNGIKRMSRVANLVLLAFVGESPPRMEVCHNDGDPKNNHLSNLRYDTHKANMEDMSRHSRARKSVRFSCPQIVYIRTNINEKKLTVDDLASEFGVTENTIISICKGKTYKKCSGPIVKKMPYQFRRKIKRSNHSSKYRGVYKSKETGKYIATIWVGGRGGKPLRLGEFNEELDAARAYDTKARELHGAFAALNFPDK